MTILRFSFGWIGAVIMALFNVAACIGWSAVNVIVGGQLAHKLARIIWHLVTHRVRYDESIFAEREEQLLRRKQRQLRNLAHRLGFTLVPKPLVAATSSVEVS
jgi:hypothetical protein